MSDIQNALATHTSVPAAVVAKPRISADAFRNLTLRLKKPEPAVPSLEPAAATITLNPVVAEPASVVQVPTPVVMEAALVPELPSIAPEVVQPAVEMVAPVVTESFSIAPIEPIKSVADVVLSLDVEPAPKKSSPLEMVLSLPEAPAALAFPPLPEYVPPPAVVQPVAQVTVAPILTTMPDLTAPVKFEDNFTYVPEPGKTETPQNLEGIDEAVKLEVAQRAAELELENIWRLMLAKPTSEDRIAYLREASEIHAADEEWNKPEPEHDLSKIAPAIDVEPLVFSPSPVEDTILEAGIVVPTEMSSTALPIVAEGQDLAELTRSLLDMMAAGNTSGLPQERALAADTLLRLVPRLELKPLVLLGQRLAMMESPPTLLVSRLIRDPRVEVAGPLLADCVHITDKDLEQIVSEGEPDKLRMIGRRRKLSRPISDALIKSGDPSVVLTLVRNMEAEISHDGYLSLLVLCENHEELLAPLATRQDLAAPVAFELFWLAPAQLRRFILSRFLTDSETLTKILKITKMANAEDESEGEPMSQFVLLEALERAARGHTEIAAEELGAIMQLTAATVARILGDLQGEAIIVMLKAAGYPRSSLPGLLKRLQDAEMPLISRQRDIADLQSMFETLSFNKARILLTYWDWAQSKTGPYAPVH